MLRGLVIRFNLPLSSVSWDANFSNLVSLFSLVKCHVTKIFILAADGAVAGFFQDQPGYFLNRNRRPPMVLLLSTNFPKHRLRNHYKVMNSDSSCKKTSTTHFQHGDHCIFYSECSKLQNMQRFEVIMEKITYFYRISTGDIPSRCWKYNCWNPWCLMNNVTTNQKLIFSFDKSFNYVLVNFCSCGDTN